MTDKTTESLFLHDEDLDELNRRLGMAENRLNAVRGHRLMRQQESLELLTKIEERFIQQRNDLLHAQDHIRQLEKMNREMVGKLRRIVSAVEAGMDAADDIFYRMINVTNEISNFSNQSLTGEYHSHAMLDGLDITGQTPPAAGSGDAASAETVRGADADSRPGQDGAPAARGGRETLSIAPGDGVDRGAQVLDIKAIFSKG